MVFEISEYYTGGKIRLKPRVELYDTRDYTGKQMPGLAIVLDEVDQNENVTEQYAVLTVSFGDFLALKNCAFIDTNNCPFAPQLLSDEIAQDTGHSKISGYCEYPLWVFKEDFLKEIGGEKYEQYSEQFDAYMRREMSEDDMKWMRCAVCRGRRISGAKYSAVEIQKKSLTLVSRRKLTNLL